MITPRQPPRIKLLSTLLWLVSFAAAILDFVALHRLLQVAIVLFVPADPGSRVMTKYRAVSLERWGLIVIATLWLGAIVALYYSYAASESRRGLLRRFGISTAAQVAIAALGYGAGVLAVTLVG